MARIEVYDMDKIDGNGSFEMLTYFSKKVLFEAKEPRDKTALETDRVIKLDLSAVRMKDMPSNVWSVDVETKVSIFASKAELITVKLLNCGLFMIDVREKFLDHYLYSMCPEEFYPHIIRQIANLTVDAGLSPLIITTEELREGYEDVDSQDDVKFESSIQEVVN